MEEELKSIIDGVQSEIPSVGTAAEFEQFKARISGPNGSFTAMSKKIATLPVEERPVAGKLINVYKKQLQAIWDKTLARLEAEALARKIGPAIDPSLASPEISQGSTHILTQVREEIVRILHKIGVDGIGGYFDADEVAQAGLNTATIEEKTPEQILKCSYSEHRNTGSSRQHGTPGGNGFY